VRRYMTLLADLGIRVEAGRGRHGGYRPCPGYKLPPLMFSEDEALALVLGLLVVWQSGLAGTPADTAGSLTTEHACAKRQQTGYVIYYSSLYLCVLYTFAICIKMRYYEYIFAMESWGGAHGG